jgi:hypothetical protein
MMGRYDRLYPAPGRILRTWGVAVVDALNELAAQIDSIKSAKFDHSKQLFTIDAIAEQTLFSAKGAGLVVVELSGDGDGVFRVRIYTDGNIEDEFPTNKAITRVYAFDSSFDLRLFNPLSTSRTASSETIRLRGLVRYTG